jgi:hypothetical protein
MTGRQGPDRFHREPHPISYEELVAFASGESGPVKLALIETHVGSCPDCAATVARLRLVQATVRADASQAPSAAALKRVLDLASGLERAAPRRQSNPFAGLRRLVAALGFDGRAQPATAGLRGQIEGYHLVYSREGIEVDLAVAPDDRATASGLEDRWTVMGQVAGSGGTGAVPVALAEPGTLAPLVETVADEEGMFTICAPGGTYDLLVGLPEGVLILPRLTLAPPGIS